MNILQEVFSTYLDAHRALVAEMQKLDNIAYFLYERLRSFSDIQSQLFDRFEDEEFALLWVMCMITDTNPCGRAYDDEVYEAIQRRENSREIFDSAHWFYDHRGEYLYDEEIKQIDM